MRARQRAPSQCNIHLQTLSLPSFCFYTRRTIYQKTKTIQQTTNKKEARRMDGYVPTRSPDSGTATAMCISSLSRNYDQANSIWEITTLSSCHFCTLHRFFLKLRNDCHGAEGFFRTVLVGE